MTGDYGLLRAPRQTIFGRGTISAVGPIARRWGPRCLLLVDANLPEDIALRPAIESLRANDMHVCAFAEPQAGSTSEYLERVLKVARPANVDVIVAVGGGTTLDAGKLLSVLLRWPGPLDRYFGEGQVPGPCMPVVGVPATAGTGSEVSPISVVSDPARGLKVVVSSPETIPVAAICDPDLTLTCPRVVTAHAGIDALANAIESYTSARRASRWEDLVQQVFVGTSPLTSGYALQGAGLIGQNLARVVEDGDDIDARGAMLLGSLHAGLAYAQSGTGAVHALNYPVEAAAHVTHGLGVGLLLPYVMAFNLPARTQELADIAIEVGAAPRGDDSEAAARALVDWVVDLDERIGIPRSLAEIGIARGQLDALAEESGAITRLLRNNGRPASPSDLRQILEAAWLGDRSVLNGV